MDLFQRLGCDKDQLERVCHRWDIIEFCVFGSILTESFSRGSDIDVLITFDPCASRGLEDIAQIQSELRQLFGRSVDLVTKPAIQNSPNWIRKKLILGNAQSIYAA